MTQSRDATLKAMLGTGVVAVVRAEDASGLVGLAQALRDGGVVHTEITMTVPGALKAIESAVSQLDEEVFIGAGTVLDAVTARLAINAGASFIVGPNFDPEVVAMAHRYGVMIVPGCLTPNESVQAWSAGVDVIKLFPGRVATPGYFADLRGPFPQVRLMPTGNVDIESAPEYIRAGAVAVGVGKALVDGAAFREQHWSVITENARRFVDAVDGARG